MVMACVSVRHGHCVAHGLSVDEAFQLMTSLKTSDPPAPTGKVSMHAEMEIFECIVESSNRIKQKVATTSKHHCSSLGDAIFKLRKSYSIGRSLQKQLDRLNSTDSFLRQCTQQLLSNIEAEVDAVLENGLTDGCPSSDAMVAGKKLESSEEDETCSTLSPPPSSSPASSPPPTERVALVGSSTVVPKSDSSVPNTGRSGTESSTDAMVRRLFPNHGTESSVDIGLCQDNGSLQHRGSISWQQDSNEYQIPDKESNSATSIEKAAGVCHVEQCVRPEGHEGPCTRTNGSQVFDVFDKSSVTDSDTQTSCPCSSERSSLLIADRFRDNQARLEDVSLATSHRSSLIADGCVALQISFDADGDWVKAEAIDVKSCVFPRSFHVHHTSDNLARDLRLVLVDIVGVPECDDMLSDAIFAGLNSHYDVEEFIRLTGWIGSDGASLSILERDLREDDCEQMLP